MLLAFFDINSERRKFLEVHVMDGGHEKLLFVVTSTFGSGESPGNGASFAAFLEGLKNETRRPLKNLRYIMLLFPYQNAPP